MASTSNTSLLKTEQESVSHRSAEHTFELLNEYITEGQVTCHTGSVHKHMYVFNSRSVTALQALVLGPPTDITVELTPTATWPTEPPLHFHAVVRMPLTFLLALQAPYTGVRYSTAVCVCVCHGPSNYPNTRHTTGRRVWDVRTAELSMLGWHTHECSELPNRCPPANLACQWTYLGNLLILLTSSKQWHIGR